MSRLTKFLENELDRINDYLGMAKGNLTVVSELCENRLSQISPALDSNECQVVDYLNKELILLSIKISESKQIISNFKNYYHNLETQIELNK